MHAAVPPPDPTLRRPFPLLSGNAATAGRALAALGVRLGEIRLPPGARVAVFGPGLGNLAIALARLGFAVTAVDPDPAVCAFVSAQAARRGVAVDAAAAASGPFDAVVIEQQQAGPVLPGLRDLVPDGPVYLMQDPAAVAPFREALLQAGWVGRRRCSADVPWAPVWELSRWPTPVQRVPAADGRLGTIVGVKAPRAGSVAIRVEAAAAGCLVFGPHIPLPPGRFRGAFEFDGPAEGLLIDACRDRVTVLAQAAVPTGAARAVLEFELDRFADEVEVRLFCEAGARAVVTGLQLVALDHEPAGGPGLSPPA